ncbi:hypothetical protein CY34DRAFT_811004 [Suillus luteus UH-Slu-Lm8-n1]|uniref:Uncharacterized protein n=1 Tax=Suillus luteus UH-Slu-Lm8-n1 TaxID=930992 RepID=A0A0D0AR61_9AGAM|nr:hypothetical protein CY34DRAFT_811004 [Suillus luteus UH-Slu-Lm8-n1]
MSFRSQFTRGHHANFLRQPPSIYPMTTATKFRVHPLFFPSYFHTRSFKLLHR